MKLFEDEVRKCGITLPLCCLQLIWRDFSAAGKICTKICSQLICSISNALAKLCHQKKNQIHFLVSEHLTFVLKSLRFFRELPGRKDNFELGLKEMKIFLSRKE